MPEYVYKALGTEGRRVRGSVTGPTRMAVAGDLIRKGLHPLEIRPREALLSRFHRILGRKRLGHRERALIARQLSDLVTAGMPVHSALRIIGRQSNSPAVKGVMSELIRVIEDGKPLSKAIQDMPRDWSPVHASLIRAGESGGFLTRVLDELANIEERDDELKARVRAALAYPSITSLVGLLTILVIINFVIPRLSAIFEEMGSSLPWTTRLLMALGGSSDIILPLTAIALAGGVLAYALLRRSARWLERKDGWLIKAPVVGALLLQTNISRFAGVLGSLVRHGVPLDQALRVSMETLGNLRLRRNLEPALHRVNEGGGLGASLEAVGVLPPVVTGMITVGEETGHLEDTLDRISQSAFRQAERRMKVAVSLIEPALIILLGVVVAFLLASIMLPIFQVELGS